jgi:hypothetical protein
MFLGHGTDHPWVNCPTVVALWDALIARKHALRSAAARDYVLIATWVGAALELPADRCGESEKGV